MASGTSELQPEGGSVDFELGFFPSDRYDMLVRVQDGAMVAGLSEGDQDSVQQSHHILADADSTPDTYVLRNDIDVTADTQVDVDVESEGVVPSWHTFAFDPAASEESVNHFIALNTTNGLYYGLPSRTDSYAALPASVLGEGGVHVFTASAVDFGRPDGTATSREARLGFAEARDLSIELPQVVEAKVEKISDSPYARYSFEWSENDAALYELVLSESSSEHFNLARWRIQITKGWSPEGEYTLPDLGSLEGWQEEWLDDGGDLIETHWWVNSYGWRGPYDGDLFGDGEQKFVDGLTFLRTETTGSIEH